MTFSHFYMTLRPRFTDARPCFTGRPLFCRNLAMFLNDPPLVCFGLLNQLLSLNRQAGVAGPTAAGVTNVPMVVRRVSFTDDPAASAPGLISPGKSTADRTPTPAPMPMQLPPVTVAPAPIPPVVMQVRHCTTCLRLNNQLYV
jgi:hypothetical protein